MLIDVHSQSTEELFSLPGLRFGVDGIDNTGARFDRSIFYWGDTIYDGNKFLIYQDKHQEYFYVKIDGKKIFHPSYNVTHQNNSLLFDFGLDVGDSFYSAAGYYNGDIKVIEKSFVKLSDGLNRVKMVLENQTNDAVYTWIEGIGFEDLGINLEYKYWPDLKCVSSDAGDIYLAEGFSSEDCDARGCLFLHGNFNIIKTIKNKVFLRNGSYNYTELRLDMGDGTVFDEFVEEYQYQEHGCYNIEITTRNECGDIAYRQHFFDYCGDPIWQKKSATKIGGVHFYTAEEGVGVRSDSLFVTTDGGQSWQYEPSNLPQIFAEADYKAIKFQENGFGLCLTYHADEDDYCYFVTKNWGKHWDRTDNSNSYKVLDINEIGVMLRPSVSRVDISYDYGQTWVKLDYDMQSTAREVSMTGDSIISLFEVIKTEYGGVKSNFIITKDLGSTWESFHFDEVLTKTEIIDDKTWLVTGNQDLYITKDGGESWNIIFSFYGFDRFAREIKFFDADFGYLRMYKELFRTEDGGATWSIENCAVSMPYNFFLYEDKTTMAMINGELYEWRPNPDYECETVSIEDHANSPIQVYPNPTSGFLSITGLEAYAGLMDIKIYTMDGALVHSEPVNITKNEVNLDINDLKDGFYILNISQKGKSFSTHKVVVTR